MEEDEFFETESTNQEADYVSIVNEQLIIKLRDYLRSKTGITYFQHIKARQDNIQVTCPFHKHGQENKPSASIRITENDKTIPGMFNCFTCGEAMPLDQVIEKILGPLYDSVEVETLFALKSMLNSPFIKPKKPQPLFTIADDTYVDENILRQYRKYHPYLAQRRISEDTALKYDIGFDSYNDQITFPIRDIHKNCLGVGRRSIKMKQYRYPEGMRKPVYGIYELPDKVNYLYICEGPFNLWSLSQWGKQAVALLGTGTENQYKQLLTLNCRGYVCSLDNDPAGIKGTKKLIEYLTAHKKYNIYVAVYPEGKDVNDLTQEEFKNIIVYSYKEWLNIYAKS